MLFNSIDFILFFAIIWLAYWSIPSSKIRFQNILLLCSSYFFYSCWDIRFLGLLIFSTWLDYFSGKQIFKVSDQASKKAWLVASIVINLGFLAVFKYYNFFIDNFKALLNQFDISFNAPLIEIILPVGISFYTFHGISYVIDIYKNKAKVCNNPIDYALFVSFFPLLVAGPIERATHLLPQIQTNRLWKSEKIIDGLRQVIWGLFKKIVIADTCAKYVDIIFDSPDEYSAGAKLVGAILFSIQVYGDFSGYSDIALGTARMLGFELLQNFKFPFFSRSIPEFWQRWHLSLSTWFRDYVYIPLGGSKNGKAKHIRNILIVFFISGLWHGASWNKVLWGLSHGFFMIGYLYFKPTFIHNTIGGNRIIPSLKEFIHLCITFILCTITFIIFRTSSIQESVIFFKEICHAALNVSLITETLQYLKHNLGITPCILIAIMIIAEWLSRNKKHTLEAFEKISPSIARWLVYLGIVVLIFLFSSSSKAFVYFQF